MAILSRRARKAPAGAPSWIVTFADLATLLLTFFILLLSFSQLDAQKYYAMATSMAAALGGGKVLDTAPGGSPLTLIESNTVSLPEPDKAATDTPQLIDERGQEPAVTKVPGGILDLASRLIGELEPEVASGALDVSYDTEAVVVRFSEGATFQSGDAEIKPAMMPIIDRMVEVLAQCTGDVMVAGYTDDQPIVSRRYRSNWDLSAARAVSVVHQLVLDRQIPAGRVTAAGRAETHPLVPNDSPEHRARNRRVEITIRKPTCEGRPPTPATKVDVRS